MEVYEVVDVGPVRTRLQAAVARGLTRFVGRARELDTLTQALARAGAGHGGGGAGRRGRRREVAPRLRGSCGHPGMARAR